MDSLDRLGLLTSTTRCPSCDEVRLQLVLRCDLGTQPCLVTARCEACQTTYRVDPAEPQREVTSSCPSCGSSAHELRLQCDAASHACAEIRVCARCGATALPA